MAWVLCWSGRSIGYKAEHLAEDRLALDDADFGWRRTGKCGEYLPGACEHRDPAGTRGAAGNRCVRKEAKHAKRRRALAKVCPERIGCIHVGNFGNRASAERSRWTIGLRMVDPPFGNRIGKVGHEM